MCLYNWKPAEERMMFEKDMDRMTVLGMKNSDFLDILAGVQDMRTVVVQDMIAEAVQDMMAEVVQDMMVVAVQDKMAVAVQDMMAVFVQDMVVVVNHTEVVLDMVDSYHHEVEVAV